MTESPIDAAALTEALRRAGVLRDARVDGVAVERCNTTVLSRIVRLRLSYDGAAEGAPSSVIFKTGKPDRLEIGWNAVRHETAFYTEVATAAATRHLPRCFDARCDEASKSWHLVLEDLTDTHHVASAWPLPPGMADCERIVRAHARHQAAYWDKPCLGGFMGGWNWRDGAATEAFVGRLAAQVDIFAERLGDRLPAERRDLFMRLVDAVPRLAPRYAGRRNLTVVQGDSHVWNCFLPRDGGEDARLFDWDAWRIDVGASDLAYMMAIHWYPDRRQRMERALLDAYHAELLAHGVEGYSRRALEDDYRFAVLWQMTWPMWQERYGIPPVIWWNNLERVLMAVDDLGCRELLR